MDISDFFTITCLGTGTSHGVPVVGCDCPVCRSEDPRNRRSRCSLWIEVDGVSLIIDTATELRMQAVREQIPRVDAVLYTHDHADHVNGIDDLRGFCQKFRMEIPLYGRKDALENIRRRWPFMFPETGRQLSNVAKLKTISVDAPFVVNGVEITPIPVLHGDMVIFGYRIGKFAYLTDCSEIPESSFPLLRGLDTLIVDGLRPRPHYTHFSLGQACLNSFRLKPRVTFLTHLTHNVDHGETEKNLPPGTFLAYDGLRLECPR